MHSKAFLLLPLALGLVTAQDVEQGDYPGSCNASCDPVRLATERCDQQFDDDDQGQQNCICNTNNMSTLLPECLACVAPQRNVEDYNEGWEDINQLLQACGFSTTSVSGVAPITGSTVYTTTRTTTEADGEVDTDTDEVTSFLTGTAGAATPTQTVITTTSNGETTVITSSVSPSPTGGNSAQSASSSSPNAAVITGAPLMGAAAGIVAAMIAF